MDTTALGDAHKAKTTSEQRAAFDLWAVGGAVLCSLSASAKGLLNDASKAVRAKALSCSLRILVAHGRDIPSSVSLNGVVEGPSSILASCGVTAVLGQVRRFCSYTRVHTFQRERA